MERIQGIDWQGGSNASGLLRLKVVDTFDVLAFFDPKKFRDIALNMDGPILPSGAIVLKPGTNFQEIAFPASTATFSETLASDANGEVWNGQINVTVPKDSPTAAYAIQKLTGRRLIAVILDANGYTRLVGSPKTPLSTGLTSITEQNTIVLSTTTLGRSYFLPGYEDAMIFGQADFSVDFSLDFNS